MGYSFQLATRVLLYASSHRQDNTYHSLCYTSRGALAGTRNSSMCPLHEGSIRRPMAPWANALTAELHLALTSHLKFTLKRQRGGTPTKPVCNHLAPCHHYSIYNLGKHRQEYCDNSNVCKYLPISSSHSLQYTGANIHHSVQIWETLCAIFTLNTVSQASSCNKSPTGTSREVPYTMICCLFNDAGNAYF